MQKSKKEKKQGRCSMQSVSVLPNHAVIPILRRGEYGINKNKILVKVVSFQHADET